MSEIEKDHYRNLFFGMQDSMLKHISEVANGLKCNCICPACNEQLIARNGGAKRIHHFAHYKGNECKYGFQTSIHLVAKEILEKCGKIKIPSFSASIKVGIIADEYKSYKISEEVYVKIEKVILEKKLHNYIPDVIVFARNKKLIIEIAVTHFVGRKKIDKIKESKTSAIEIDLSKIDNDFNRNELEKLIVDDLSLKTWLHNQYGEEKIAIKRAELLKEAERIMELHKEHEKNKKRKEREIWYEGYYKEVIDRKVSNNSKFRQVENCPLKKRSFKGQYYANIALDCLNCEHSRGTRDKGKYLICLYEYNFKKRKFD